MDAARQDHRDGAALMPCIADYIKVAGGVYDRRRRLTKDDKDAIRAAYNAGDSIHAIAYKYKVCRRTVQFILFPERLEHNNDLRRLRGGSRIYYDRQAHTEAMRRSRAHKKELYDKGILQRSKKQ